MDKKLKHFAIKVENFRPVTAVDGGTYRLFIVANCVEPKMISKTFKTIPLKSLKNMTNLRVLRRLTNLPLKSRQQKTLQKYS